MTIEQKVYIALFLLVIGIMFTQPSKVDQLLEREQITITK